MTAEFWADILGTELGVEWGPFIPLPLDNGVTFDFANVPPHVTEISPQHYAFLISEAEFDAAYAKIQRYQLEHWADPRQQGVNEINHNDGGRGVNFHGPNRPIKEMKTLPKRRRPSKPPRGGGRPPP
ncbi:hypothetical protein, partial [Nocardia brasiliensis]|uniref:hypothetical protein n=1 Tax=Nocardia brasiliensis TaxID=37326 RepID=UPI0024568A5D